MSGEIVALLSSSHVAVFLSPTNMEVVLMANTPTNNTQTPLSQILSSLPQSRFGNGFAIGTVSDVEEYMESPEIFLNVPKNPDDMWDINIVDDSGEDIIPVISCFGTRQLFSINEIVHHFPQDADINTRLESAIMGNVPTSLSINFSPVAPPFEESAYIEVKYKGLVARVVWEWAEGSDDVIVKDFEGKRLRISVDGRSLKYSEA
jgi:hypothetical protein